MEHAERDRLAFNQPAGVAAFLEAPKDVANMAEIGRRNTRRAGPEPMCPLDPCMRLPATAPNGGAVGFVAVLGYRIAVVREQSVDRSSLEMQRQGGVPHEEMRSRRPSGTPFLTRVRPRRRFLPKRSRADRQDISPRHSSALFRAGPGSVPERDHSSRMIAGGRLDGRGARLPARPSISMPREKVMGITSLLSTNLGPFDRFEALKRFAPACKGVRFLQQQNLE